MHQKARKIIAVKLKAVHFIKVAILSRKFCQFNDEWEEDWDEAEHEDTLLTVLFSNEIMEGMRKSSKIYVHIFWDDHMLQPCLIGKFQTRFCMSESVFHNPLGILYLMLHKEVSISNNSSGV